VDDATRNYQVKSAGKIVTPQKKCTKNLLEAFESSIENIILMNKTVVENKVKKEFQLNHKEITLFIDGSNRTTDEAPRFENQMGYYAENTDSWVFPSPLDAIQAFSNLGK